MLSEAIQARLSECRNKILIIGEVALHPSQFKAFRKLVLDELGRNGLESDLEKILANSKQQQER